MVMMGPISSFGMISESLGFFIAVIIGIFFGFFLERGGLGNPRKLTGVFYLTDFTVPKVMFSAIATAAVGLYLMADLQLIDIGRVWIVPTFFWPQIVGGALFGVGFVVSGYCPGTAVTGLSSGRIDALFTLIGVGVGSLVFAFFFPLLENFYNSSAMGGVTLPQLMGVNHWLVIALVVVIAIGMFIMLERFENRGTRLIGKEAFPSALDESVELAPTHVKHECTTSH
jgi:uncharacterized membrane protein YedE/YeeE